VGGGAGSYVMASAAASWRSAEIPFLGRISTVSCRIFDRRTRTPCRGTCGLAYYVGANRFWIPRRKGSRRRSRDTLNRPHPLFFGPFELKFRMPNAGNFKLLRISSSLTVLWDDRHIFLLKLHQDYQINDAKERRCTYRYLSPAQEWWENFRNLSCNVALPNKKLRNSLPTRTQLVQIPKCLQSTGRGMLFSAKLGLAI
jgi:hypothetical protein